MRYLRTPVAVALMAFGLFACGSGPRVVYIDASWTRLYHDIPSLRADADIAVSGKVLRSSAVVETPPATDFTFLVDAVLHARAGLPIAAPTTIVVHQSGGIQNGQMYEVSDDPPFQIGEIDVLFLHQYAPGRFFVLGGPSGRFLIGSDGMVRPVNIEGVALQPTPKDAFFKEIRTT